MSGSEDPALSPGEREIARCYEILAAAVAEHGADLPPFAERNAQKALAALWQVVNGLDLEPPRGRHGALGR